jgi:Sensors of blue-light using FAD
MIRLLYISTSCDTPATAQQNLADILEKSKKNNAELGITGILVCGGNMFLQVLEGPQEQVLRKYVRILDDKRHADCRIVLITTAEKRAFPTWAMGIINIPPHEFQEVRSMIDRRQETADAKDFGEVIELFMKRIPVGRVI